MGRNQSPKRIRPLPPLLRLAFLAALLPRIAGAQTAADSAAAVAQRFLDAVAEERWAEAAGLIHPETLRELQRRDLERLECSEDNPRPKLEEIVVAHPGLPRVEAESLFYRSLRPDEHLERWEFLESRYPGVRSVAELAAMPAREFAVRYLASERARFRAMGRPVGFRDTVFGGVREGDWIDVLYRHRYELQEADPTGDVEFVRPPPKVLRLRRSPEGWRIGHAGELLRQFVGDMGPGVVPSIQGICVHPRTP